MRTRKLRNKDSGEPEPIRNEEPARLDETVQQDSAQTYDGCGISPELVPTTAPASQESPMNELVPASDETATIDSGDAKESPSPRETPSLGRFNLPSARSEFAFRTGSLGPARERMFLAYLAVFLAPTVILLAGMSSLKGQSTEDSRSLLGCMEFMLGVTAGLGIPNMVVSWFGGFYPKGSYGRFASGSILAVLLGLWLILVLVASGLQDTFAQLGVAIKLDWVSAVISMTVAYFFFGQAASEMMKNRKEWKKQMGPPTRRIRLDLGSPYLDFDHHIGNWGKGNSTAWMAYIKFVVAPIVILVAIDHILRGLDLEAKGAILGSINSMFWIVLLFGAMMVLVRFARGYYPCGSISRATFGLLGIPVLSMYAWMILVGSGVEKELAENHFFIDMSLVMLPVILHVLFIAVFELSELKDGRRAYRRWIGLPVDPYVPEETYDRFSDFQTFFASFTRGARIERYVLDKYVVQVLAVTILFAIAVSVYQSPSSEGLNETVRSYMNPSVLTRRVDNMVITMVALAIANTTVEFLAFSYRQGSFARMVISVAVAIFASQWAYYFWTSLSKLFQPGTVTRAINSVMLAVFGLIMVRVAWDMYKGYLRTRNNYIEWRLAVLRDELSVSRPASAPGVTGLATAPMVDP
jgi:hypothetical protein